MGKTLGAAILLLATFSLPAHAGYVRYDVSFNNPECCQPDLGTFGYMIFESLNGVAGNLMPNIVDWRFDVGFYVFDPSNTQPFANSEFIVDAAGNFVSDGEELPTTSISNPCFSANACLGLNVSGMSALIYPYITFSRNVINTNLSGISAAISETEIVYQTAAFGLTYSGPIQVVHGPGSLYLLGAGLLALIRFRATSA